MSIFARLKKSTMSKHKHHNSDKELHNELEEQIEELQEKAEENKEEVKAETKESEEEKEDKRIAEAEEKLAKSKDEYLRLAAEFDNYRRRVAKEKLDLISTAGEGVIKALLPIVDDFERAIQALEASDDSQAAKEGTKLIYKKLIDMLKAQGVTEIEAKGLELDTDLHEAIAQIPAEDHNQKGKIIDVTQKGYKLGDKVIRFAKVVVGA